MQHVCAGRRDLTDSPPQAVGHSAFLAPRARSGPRGRGADLCVRLGEVVVYDDAGNGPRVEDVSVVARHIQNVFAEGELDRATSLQNAARGQAGQLDIVDSVAIIRP